MPEQVREFLAQIETVVRLTRHLGLPNDLSLRVDDADA